MRRPKIKLPYSLPEKLLQVLSLALLIGMIALTVSSASSLPATIPTHFGADGRPDGWGGKGSLLMLPILSAVLAAGLTVLERFPWMYNYPVEITEENAAVQYKMARQMLEWMKLFILAVFFYLQWQTVQAARNLSSGIGAWFLPAFLLVMFGTMGVMIYRMKKNQ